MSRERRPVPTKAWWIPWAVFVSALATRLFNIGRVLNFLDDRLINVPAAFNYVRYGMTGPDNWFTQPAKHLFLYWDIAAFGNDAVGWGMRQVVFGTGIVVVTYLLARRVFRAQFPALFAAAVVGLDPLNIAFSRAGSEDPLAVFFMLLAMLFWVRGLDEDRDLEWLAAGAFIGIAMATRWYAVFVFALMLGIGFWVRRRDRLPVIVKAGAFLGIAPVCSYLVWFMPWMSRGYSLGELWSLHVDSLLVQSSGAYPTFDPALVALTQPQGWFVRWIGVGTSQSVSNATGAFTVIVNDPVVWLFFLPAVVYLTWTAYRRRLPEFWLLATSFIVLYGFFALVRRPIYLYSALSIVPIGAMALGHAAGRLLKRWSLAVLALVVAWSLYLYPITSAIVVSIAPFSWLLSRITLSGAGR